MIEKPWKVWKCVTVEHKLGLFVGASDDIAYGTQRRCLDFDFAMREQGYQFWDDTGINNHLDLIIAAISEIAQCPYGVHKDLEGEKKASETFVENIMNTKTFNSIIWNILK